MSGSVLTKDQKVHYEADINYGGRNCKIRAVVRYDDECGNGHNTFSITGTIVKAGFNFNSDSGFMAGGCVHGEIAKAFPDLAPLIKWHLCSSDGPLHYIANTAYHVRQHGPNKAWIYYTGSDPLGLDKGKERLICYADGNEANRCIGVPGYRIKWDDSTVKVRNLDHARSSAIWPDATDEDLTAPGLEDRLRARLPALMAEFRKDVESLGFTW